MSDTDSHTGITDACECGLPLKPPASGEYWLPELDDEPNPRVLVVVRLSEPPELRRAVRRSDGTGWCEHGAMVRFYHDRTPPMPWHRVGTCWAERSHPVTRIRGGEWADRCPKRPK